MASPNELSFLPDDYLERKTLRRTNFIFAFLFLMVMGGIVWAFSLLQKSTRDLEVRHGEVEQQYTEAARRIEQVRQMQDKQKRMARQAELTASLLERVPRSFVLAEITNALPAGTSLIEVIMDSKVRAAAAPVTAKTAYEQKKAEMEKKKAADATPEPKLYDVSMKLTGLAVTDVQVAQFINRLGRSDLLTDVNLLISDEFAQGDQKLRKFQIEMKLNPSAHVQPDTPTESRTAGVFDGSN